MSSSQITLIFILVGFYAGKTVSLGKYRFVDGKCTITATPEQMALHARALERNWQAFPQGDSRIEEFGHEQRDLHKNTKPDGKHTVPGDGVPGGEGSAPGEGSADGGGDASANAGGSNVQTAGNGSAEELKPLVNDKLARAVAALDPKDDTHWTADGRPAMVAVQQFYGATDITRADVEAAAPNVRRPAVE